MKTKDFGKGQIEVGGDCLIARPIELLHKEDGSISDEPSFAIVMTTDPHDFFGDESYVTPKIVGEVSLKMLTKALSELGYVLTPTTSGTSWGNDKIDSLTKDLKIAVKFLKDGKLKFAPNTTNSDVDLFLEKHRSL